MKKLYLLLFIAAISLNIMAQTATKPIGDGSESNPYQITTWQNLYWMSQQKNNFQEWGKNYIQTADIDFGNADPAINTWNGGKGWEPIGYYAMPNPNVNFYGTYNGQGYTIKNLYINASETNAALFAYTENATIVNLGLVDVDISGAIGGVAALVSNSNNTTIEKCYSTGNITNLGDWTAGGLVAHNGGTIKNSYSTASVIGKDWTGGFVGNNSSGTIENCYSTGSVNSSGSEGIGGFVGNNTYYDNEGTVVNSYWDKQTSDVPESAGTEQGKTTAEMKQQSTFATWDFDNVWAIETSTNSGYPHLQFAGPTNETPEAIMPEGIGSEESPFLIATWQNLYWLSQNPDYWYDEDWSNKYYFEQTADIDFAEATPAIETWGMGRGWLPIGKEKEFDLDHDSKAFKSVYNGKGYAIKNLYINRPMQDNVGLFGYTGYAIIKNINLENVNIIGKDNVGALVGKQTGAIIHPAFLGLHNSYANGTITGGENVGGLVGSNEDGYIEKSYSSVTVNGNWKVGGLVGNNTRKTGSTVTTSHIVDCYSTGNVVSTGTSLVGGLVGSNYKSEIKNSYSIGSISAPEQQQGYSYTVGGLVGSNYDGTITNCYWNTQTSGFATSDGGEGKTTANMKMQNTYSDWDFVMVWQISESVNNGYPSFIKYEPQGQGTEENPYLIATWHNLKWISDNSEEWDKHYLQTANIEFPDVIMDWNNGEGWSPIGKGSNSFFTGVYNGQNFTISNLYINSDDDYIGLFGNVSGGYAKLININIVDADVKGGGSVGALAGYIYSTSVENCHSSGNIKGSGSVGGLVGSYTWTKKMIKCSSSANVDGYSRVGGLVGFVGGNGGIGGIENCFSSGVVKGTEFVGGFAGEGSGARIIESYATGNVVEGKVGGYSSKGGFIGKADGGSINKCYATGSVTATPDNDDNKSYDTGGFAGSVYSHAKIENSYAMGNVSGCKNVGGFIGKSTNAQIKYSYSIGTATASVENNGGFIAMRDGGTVTACFWNTVTSGLANSDGGEGKTTAEMKTESTFTNADWDFEEVWMIDANSNNGFPIIDIVEKPEMILPLGDGSETNPYQISSWQNLLWVTENEHSWDGYFIQTKNIDFSKAEPKIETWNKGKGWKPIGQFSNENSIYKPFNGTYNGQNFHIKGLYSNYIGIDNFEFIAFLGYTANADIKNIHLTDLNFKGKNVGGIIGFAENSTITQSSVKGSTHATRTAAGFISECSSSTISNCYSFVSANGEGSVGGFIATSWTSTISSSYSIGEVTGGFYWVGGFINSDDQYENTVLNCFWDKETSGAGGSRGNGLGKTTAEMKTKATFTNANWDFDNIWLIDANINDGYPTLKAALANQTSLPNLSVQKNVTAFPNPCSEYITISNIEKASNIVIYNLMGNKVMEIPISGLNTKTINTTNLDKGMYLLTIQFSDNKSQTLKFIKK